MQQPTTMEGRVEPPARSFSELPSPKGLPLLGNMHQIKLDRMHLVLEQWSRAFGDFYAIKMGPMRVLVVSDGEAARDVLQRRPDDFCPLQTGAKAFEGICLGGLGLIGGDTWRRQRKLMNPTFQPKHVEAFFPTLQEIIGRLQERWGEMADADAACDVLTELYCLSVDVTSAISFGRDLNTLQRKKDAVGEHLKILWQGVTRRLFSPFPYWRYVSLPHERSLIQACASLKDTILGLISGARKELDADPARRTKPRTLLELMILARDDEDAAARMTDEEIYANVIGFLLAGEDTTASTMAWILYYLGSRPDVQDRAREEVDRVLGGALLPTLEDCKRLPYVGAIAHETLRLRPPVPSVAVEAIHDTVVGDVAVPRGTAVIPQIRSIARKPEYFGDPETFRPERWVDGRVQPHEPRMVLHFGGGPRICPGRGIALLEITSAMAMTLRSFEVCLADHVAPVEERLAVVMRPVGVRIRFKRRPAAPKS